MEKQKAQETSEVGGFTFLANPKDFEALKDAESEEDGETATEEKERIMSVNLRPNWFVTTSIPTVPHFHFLADATLFEDLERHEPHDSELREFDAAQLMKISEIDRPNQMPWFPEVTWDLQPSHQTKPQTETIMMLIPPMEAAKKEQLLSVARQYSTHRYTLNDLRRAGLRCGALLLTAVGAISGS